MDANSRELLIHQGGETELFYYEESGSISSISIYSKETRVRYKDSTGFVQCGSLLRGVYFRLCGVALDNSYQALNTVHSLVQIYEKNELAQYDKMFCIKCPKECGYDIALCCERGKYAKNKNGFVIGIKDGPAGSPMLRFHTIHVGYMHMLKNALQRAMAWIMPNTSTVLLTEPVAELSPEDKKRLREMQAFHDIDDIFR